jgi:hypothetical protein
LRLALRADLLHVGGIPPVYPWLYQGAHAAAAPSSGGDLASSRGAAGFDFLSGGRHMKAHLSGSCSLIAFRELTLEQLATLSGSVRRRRGWPYPL